MTTYPLDRQPTRIGFHYFPDTQHYREDDLFFWLPRLKNLNCSWLTVIAPQARAIPENFLTGLINHGITPILQFDIPIDPPTQTETLKILIDSYAKWGINFAVIFDQPNDRAVWPSTTWSRSDLVESFLDRFVPIADLLLAHEIYPIFPPLTPGGDYWDTSFLRLSLQGLDRRGCEKILDKLVIGAYARAGNLPLSWGHGGPERWPEARPYFTPEGYQDHRGFHIFEWYLSISEATIGKRCPMILFGLNSSTASSGSIKIMRDLDVQRTLAMAEALLYQGSRTKNSSFIPSDQNDIYPLPEEVIAGNFWLLSAEADSPHSHEAWFSPDGESDERALALERLFQGAEGHFHTTATLKSSEIPFPIEHYFLLPSLSWGLTEYYLNLARPLIRREMPTIGFSIDEARHARSVTVFGSSQHFSESLLEDLRQAGRLVRRIDPDGINIASIISDHKMEAFDD